MSHFDTRVRPYIDDEIERLAADHASGAAEILSRAAAVFSRLKAALGDPTRLSTQEAGEIVARTCSSIAAAQPDMAPLINLAAAALNRARRAADPESIIDSAVNEAAAFADDARLAATLSTEHASAIIADASRVLTHSRSSTVLGALLRAACRGRSFSVIATESRPLFEGRALAQSLASEGVSVTLVADAAAALALESADFVMLGADKITPDSVVNKTGTYMIALAARERGVPVYAVCDSSKFINLAGRKLRLNEGRSPRELWPDAPAGVEVSNRCFEPTPLEWFTSIITEGGETRPEEAGRRAATRGVPEEIARAILG